VLTCNHKRELSHRTDRIDGVPVERVPAFGTVFSTPIAPTFPAAYRRMVREVDVVHVHTPFPLVEVLDPFLTYQARLVITLHSVPTQTKWTALDPLYQAALSRFAHSAHRVVTTSEAMIDAVPFLENHRDRCEVIPPAADIQMREVGTEERETLRANVGGDDRKVILFVGRLVYYKGLNVLLRAMTEVDDAVLVIVGKGPERDRLEALAEELGVTDRVWFAGYVSDDALPVYYSIADVFTLPSVSSSEAFGIVQVEAMMHGVPVVNTSLNTGVTSVSRHEETGLTVPPEDAKALADALQTLVANPEMREALGAAARKRTRRFEKDHVVGQYADLYATVYQEPPMR
jgi:rhamnosyl/mannosyltransferase